MTHRTTMHDVRTQARALEESLRALGMIAENDTLSVHEGSKTYGIAFRLGHIMHAEDRYGNPPGGIPDYLGMTKAEAHRTLYTINRTLWAVRDHLRGSSA